MKAKDLRSKSSLELKAKVGELKRELFNLRFQAANSKLESPARVRIARREIARIKTVMAQSEAVRAKE
jgi:large subunit ribosomal protein L29